MRCDACRELLDFGDAKFCPSCGASVAPPFADTLIGQTVAGRYRITHLVAEGGMGRVYAAEQTMGATARKVAIKVLLAEYSGRDQDMQRFLRECSTVAELEHPNTIKFYDYGETPGGDLFIAMEFLNGKSLAQLLREGAFSPERVDLIIGQICGSLQEAHDHGIVHRDLKPDNIVITSPGGAPDFVKVLDFGIAKRVGGRDPKLTPLGVVLGSPPYMSPEQFTLQEVDPRSDLYSLGVVAYQMLTGKLPFEASDPLEWAALHMSALPEPIVDATIPPQMKSAVMRALSKDPTNRQESMRQFFGELTLGSGSMPPGRASSVAPAPAHLGAFERSGSIVSSPPARYPSDAPLPLPPRSPAAPQSADDDDQPTALKRTDEPSAPLPLVSRRDVSSQPELSFHEVSGSELPRISSEAEPLRGSQGTIVIDQVAAAKPVRPKLTMPDLLPPTVRDPEVGAASRGRGRTLLFAAIALVLLGSLIGLGVWAFYRRPDTPTAKREKPTASGRQTSGKPGVDAPPTPVDVRPAPPPTAGSGAEAQPEPPPTAAPAASEKLSPCQTAIFSAVQGRCDVAQRAYARCAEDSPYRPSATRALSGLCP
ncbi:MAG: protein kinase [Polyangiaceae bacterium]|nr:protein kinase [Polyangiaceae bacterium]